MLKKTVSIFPGNVKLYIQNSIFDKQKNPERSSIFLELRKFLKQKGIELNTFDLSAKNSPYRYIYFDLPYPWDLNNLSIYKLILLNRRKNILICNEPPMVIPFNYMKIIHLFFSKVFTVHQQLVDNKKVFKMKFPQSSIGIKTKTKKFKEKKFLTLINANKLPFYPFKLLSPFGKELYSERIKAIDFFEKNIPEDFSLYGRCWNKAKKYNLKEKVLGFRKYSTYKGEVVDKINTLSKFKFCICFENLTNIDGYITEKIFDCFKARCVPIYWGASDVEKYIPKGCFIDFRDFGNFKKLLEFLTSIDEKKYNRYIKNIEKLLSNKKFISLWFEKGFPKFFLKEILDYKKD